MIYLPYSDFRRSAKCLTDNHLREQRTTARQVVQDITVLHKDVPPWNDHITQLLWVVEATLHERRRRGVDDRGVVPWMLDKDTPPLPGWGTPEFHGQERMRLLHLDPTHYGRMGWR